MAVNDGEFSDLERDIARAVCSDFPWHFDALSPQAQAYWLRLARRFGSYLDARNVTLAPPVRRAA